MFRSAIVAAVIVAVGWLLPDVPAQQSCPGGVCPMPARYAPLPTVTKKIVEPTKEFVQAAPVVESCPGGVCPVQPAVQSGTYQRQWYNRDGLSLRQHAEQMHGHNTAGLTDTQVAALNDHDHNTWGSGQHFAARTPVRTAASYVVQQQPARTLVRRVVARAPVRRLLSAIRPRNVLARLRCR